ncbi:MULTISPECIES: hypothetical protein [Nonomuraea]|uniref:Uncharacterized protein n=1 Tax=Nonomuraea salmonea TaxID=46181 RepID=A0ABV5P4D5_9ACTN
MAVVSFRSNSASAAPASRYRGDCDGVAHILADLQNYLEFCC